MKQILIIVAILFVHMQAKADYGRMCLLQVIDKSEYCIFGSIVKVDSSYFWIKVEQVVFGGVRDSVVPILMFENWTCANRYDLYRKGQKEIVFFNRSNKVIDVYDYYGCGAGDEFELPITGDSINNYREGGSGMLHCSVSDFVLAAREMKSFIDTILTMPQDSNIVTNKHVISFGSRSPMHKRLIQPFRDEYFKLRYDSHSSYEEMIHPSNYSGIYNGDMRFLFIGYENKIEVHLDSYNWNELFLQIDNAKIQKKDKYFTVNPDDSSGNVRWVYVVRVNGRDTAVVSKELFRVLPIPYPDFEILNTHGYDSVAYLDKYTVPSFSHDIFKQLPYTLISFDVRVTHHNKTDVVNCRNSSGNPKLHRLYYLLRKGDKVTFYNMVVQFPDGSIIKDCPEKTIYISGAEN